MKWWKGLWLIVAGMLIFSSTATAEQKSFTDVSDSHWAKASIDFLTDREIIFGYQDGRFGVNEPITRAQAATMIMRYFGWGDLSGQEDPGYPDLSPNHWAYNEIAAIHALGILTPEGMFQPDLPVNRAEMADMLVKTFDVHSITAVKFADMSRDHWAYESVNTLAGKGVASGYPDDTFRPEANVTRAEFVVLMTKLMKEDYTEVRPGFRGAIYDLEIGGNLYQLNDPLLLTDKWLAPAELFEKMGFYVESHGKHELMITTVDGLEIHLYEGQQEVWVGDTSVQVDDPLVRIHDQFYIHVNGILKVLEKPLVFYPDQFLIRLEAPRVTVADINRVLPEAAVHVIHEKQPYWQWAKRDRDYLELMRRDGLSGQTETLLEEMRQLTEAYFAVEQEKQTIRGAHYFSDNVTGKLDALSRGIEARYRLLYEPSEYVYPAVGKSGALSVFRSPNYEFDYIVSDHHFEHYVDNNERLLNELTNNLELPIEHFEGLHIHGIPFSIRERDQDGSMYTWSGLASGSQHMLVVNSGVGTFVHEFGHNWDYKFGDAEAYLKLRGKSGYVAPSSDWADRVGENFAEDFAAAWLSDQYGGYLHKAAFGHPTDELLASIKQFVQERTPATVSETAEKVMIKGAGLLPHYMYVANGQLQVQGQSGYEVSGWIKNLSTGEEVTIRLTENGGSFEEVIQLPQPGRYQVTVGNKQTTVVYP